MTTLARRPDRVWQVVQANGAYRLGAVVVLDSIGEEYAYFDIGGERHCAIQVTGLEALSNPPAIVRSVLTAAVADQATRLKDSRLALVVGDPELRAQVKAVISPRVVAAASADAVTALATAGVSTPSGLLGSATAEGDPDDLRTLWIDHDRQKRRFKQFRDALNESTQERFRDSPEVGAPTALETLQGMEANGGDPELWLLNFARDKNLLKTDRNYHELHAWCKMLKHAACFDQLNVGSIVALECACRRVAAMTTALQKGAAHPDWSMASHIQGEKDPHELLSTERRTEANRSAREKLELEALRLRVGAGASSSHTWDQGQITSSLVEVGGLPAPIESPPPRGPKPGRGSRSRGRGGRS
jgi:hypothetical protein